MMALSYFNIVSDFLSGLSDLNDRQKNQIQDIVSYAINQTRLHIANTREQRLDVPSAILSNIWMTTAEQLESVNNVDVNRWAQMLREKARYWSDPKGFYLKRLQEYQIRLTDVEEKLNALIK